jgi:hypothetical protein
MSPTLIILLGFAPVTGLTAWLVVRHRLARKRPGRPPTPVARPALHSGAGRRPSPPTARDLQLTTVLAAPGEVLLGYKVTGSPSHRRPSGAVAPSATGTLVFSLGQDPDVARSILDVGAEKVPSWPCA